MRGCGTILPMDPRIARTRRSLREALFALTRERGLDDISVSDIADRAGVNRSTYYQHYSDKNMLLVEALDAVLEDAIGPEAELSEDSGQRILLEYLRHVSEHAALYRALLGAQGSAAVQVGMQQRVQAILVGISERDTREPFVGLPRCVGAAAVAGAGVAVIRVWLETDPLPDIEVAADWIWTVLQSHWTIPG